MTETALESVHSRNNSRVKFIIGGIIILGAVGFLIISNFSSSAQYFLTIAELRAKGTDIIGDDVRISGVVVGDSIVYDAETLRLEFDVVDNLEDLSAPLHVVYYGPKPDLLQHEAQAIIEGVWSDDGVFYAHNRADSLLLKCPTRYEQEFPEQVVP